MLQNTRYKELKEQCAIFEPFAVCKENCKYLPSVSMPLSKLCKACELFSKKYVEPSSCSQGLGHNKVQNEETYDKKKYLVITVDI